MTSVSVRRFLGTAALVVVSAAGAADLSTDNAVRLEVAPRVVTVGDPIDLRILVSLEPGARLEPTELGPAIGPFTVIDGGWKAAPAGEEAQGPDWVWSGRLSAFRTGELELPAIRLSLRREDGETLTVESPPVQVTVESVLEAAGEGEPQIDLADLKAPVGIPPDYRALKIAGVAFGALLLVAAILWWLHRRYAARLALVPAPEDPFARVAPHVWVYQELQKLLDLRLAEQGRVPEFFAELSRIVKRYLVGRYRVELMEHTTSEVAPLLRQGGAPEEALRALVELLEECDLVKFAGVLPDSAACRAAIERAYGIVDATKPRAIEDAGERGAA